jgi:predicted nucleic acid-binding protein
MIWALDASVAVKWFFTDEPRRERALAVREQLALHPEQFVAPPLFMSEMVHVLARKSGRDEPFLRAAVPLLLRLGLRTLSLGEDGWQLATRWVVDGLSGYDATYVALAASLGGRWLTDDATAARKAKKLAVALADWAPR